MKKENVKRFWNDHKKAIKTIVVLVTVPVVFIVLNMAIEKVLDKHMDEISDLVEYGYGVK